MNSATATPIGSEGTSWLDETRCTVTPGVFQSGSHRRAPDSGTRYLAAVDSRHIRIGDELADDTVIARGGLPGPRGLREDAQRDYVVYGNFGVSVFAARDLSLDELAQSVPLVRFDRLTLMTAGDVRGAGLTFKATGQDPRHHTINLGERAVGVSALCGCEHRIWMNPHHDAEVLGGRGVDLVADLNAQDDDGLGWTTLVDARHPARVKAGALLLAGNRNGQAIVRIGAVDPDGQVHFQVLPDPVAKNRHLLDDTVA